MVSYIVSRFMAGAIMIRIAFRIYINERSHAMHLCKTKYHAPNMLFCIVVRGQ